MFKRTIATALVTLCLSPFIANAEVTQADYKSAYQAAVTAHENAISHQNQWTTTIDALEATEQAAAQGDYENAVKLAHKARELSQQAVRQAEEQKKIWKRAVIR